MEYYIEKTRKKSSKCFATKVMEAHIHCQVGERTPEKKVEQIFHKPQVPPVLDILEMNGNGVSNHIVDRLQ